MTVVKKTINPFLLVLVLTVLMPLDYLYNAVKSAINAINRK